MNLLHLEFLGELELLEARLLSWSLVDGSFSSEELWRNTADFIDKRGKNDDPQEWIDAMEDDGLLFKWYDGHENRYRSRMAETVRLLSRLKQLFPKHFDGVPSWLGAPDLVSDFRFLLRPRSYPDRSESAQEHIGKWAENLSKLQTSILRAITKSELPESAVKLAGFQVRATTRILQETEQTPCSATVICAGTGSGKTLAFYLPALTKIAGSIENDGSSWTRALAIYPRNELLKDQFAETLRQLRLVNPLLKASGRRGLVIGAFFGPVPDQIAYVSNDWRPHPKGYICPFLSCPTCEDKLAWSKTDIESRMERLQCVSASCNETVGPDEVRLTRESTRRNPPDLLFTTTEMMNQRMSDKRHWHLFGVGQPMSKRPILVLLDEAHTCAGNHGAQIAYLLRRWRWRTGAKPHFVGLSATLMEAPQFFAQLTGIPRSLVEEISPATAELISNGMEYMIALRGDPMSGASLLSTSIQTVMLMRRVLEARDKEGESAYGKKVYVFTDDLDVTNRLFTNVLDAEGMDHCGRPDPRRHPEGSLANLRANHLPNEESRFENGQSWRLPMRLGHALEPLANIRVGRVSSQDTGVDADDEVIIATASLEVGFNDPEVGAVVQHKAPRDPASFLQRKGRAGRQRLMRPWTVLILSDYGRDRLAYQGYDLLFDPELRSRELPIANRHVLKMQAVHTLMDWLGREINQGHIWQDISAPSDYANTQSVQQEVAKIIEEILEGTEKYDAFVQWLRSALKLSDDRELDHLLWSPPRALMTAVLPTLHRRLTSNWLRKDQVGKEYFVHRHPLPEFITGTLFSNLSIPEVVVHAPASFANQEMEPAPMKFTQVMREFAPGRISKRFAVRSRNLRHWIPVDPAGPPEQAMEIPSFCPEGTLENLGNFLIRDADGTIRQMPVMRPFEFMTRHDAPVEIRDSSNAFPRWHSQILPPPGLEAGVLIDLPSISRWTSLIGEIRFFIHRYFEPAVIRRFTTGADATVQLKETSVSVSSRYTMNAEDAALGFTLEADAIRFLINLPETWNPWDPSLAPELIRSLRSARFRWRMETDPQLRAHASVFDIGWLAEIVLAAVTATAVTKKYSVAEAWSLLRSPEHPISLTDVPALIFQTVPMDTDPLDTSLTQRELKLRHLLSDTDVLSAIDSLIPELWASRTDEWGTWLKGRFLTTFAAAVREAIQQICPDSDVESLVIDLDAGPSRDGMDRHGPGIAEIWISEETPGGGGTVENLLPLLAEQPQRFLDLILGGLGAGEFESTDQELNQLLKDLLDGKPESQPLVRAIADMRSSSTLQETTYSFAKVTSLLRDRGFRTNHVFLTALNARILKPGSAPAMDQRIAGMMQQWRIEEDRLGIEIEARPFAHALSADETFEVALGPLPIGNADLQTWRFGALYSMMWPRGSQARNQSLAFRNPYAACLPPERLLVTSLLGPPEPSIELGTPDWQPRFESELVLERRIRLTAPVHAFHQLRDVSVSVLVRPIDTGSILLYPRIRGISRSLESLGVLWDIVTPGSIAPPQDTEQESSSSRLIVKSAVENREEIRDLLESLFAAELLQPSTEIWIVSPWISDIPLLDNRAGGFSGLDPSWPKRHITLAELLAYAMKANPSTVIHIITRPDVHNTRFTGRLRFLAEMDGNTDRLRIDQNRPELHTKGIATTNFALIGSMNLTHNGIFLLEETVYLDVNTARTFQFLVNLQTCYSA